ncbi:MAG: nickel-dependent lactate racemase [Anaerolineaceae bacterium]|nr:nickel-dependent lactate racemase [Anaerolineaceae bacterium]
MQVKMAYGKEGLLVNFPEEITLVEPEFVSGLKDEYLAMQEVLRNPLGTPAIQKIASMHDQIAIVFSDLTRPQPREKMLNILLEELSHIPSEQIVLINALGTHRPNSQVELLEMLGKEIVEKYCIEQHNAWDFKAMTQVGEPNGRPVFVNSTYMQADVKILTGFIEPHLFAGFSGGPKSVLPGITDYKTIAYNHGADIISDPRAIWGKLEGNPMWQEMKTVALMTAPDFLFNVSLNKDQEITGVFAGDLIQAHAQGTSFVKAVAMVPVQEAFDVVVTSNSGYPLDLNLYQAVKGMSAAAQIVKPGGSILITAECWEGLPDHGAYGDLLNVAEDVQGLLDHIHGLEPPQHDQWQVQVQAQILQKADVYVYSDYLDDEKLKQAKVNKVISVEKTIRELKRKYGPTTRICVMPEGPMTIPYISD